MSSWLEGIKACVLMVLANWSIAFSIVPSMAPTTRSARLSIEAETLSSKAASCYNRAITADTPTGKAESFQEGSSLRMSKSTANEKLHGALQQKARTGARKQKRMSPVDPEEPMTTDMEDLCSSGSQGDPVFSESEVMVIRTNLLSWYDSNHRDLPWRINVHSCMKSPSSADEPDAPDERCKEVSTGIEAKKEASHLGVSRNDSVHAVVYPNNISSIFPCDVFMRDVVLREPHFSERPSMRAS